LALNDLHYTDMTGNRTGNWLWKWKIRTGQCRHL